MVRRESSNSWIGWLRAQNTERQTLCLPRITSTISRRGTICKFTLSPANPNTVQTYWCEHCPSCSSPGLWALKQTHLSWGRRTVFRVRSSTTMRFAPPWKIWRTNPFQQSDLGRVKEIQTLHWKLVGRGSFWRAWNSAESTVTFSASITRRTTRTPNTRVSTSSAMTTRRCVTP